MYLLSGITRQPIAVVNSFETVKELIGKADIIVNAGDPDREGQLLVDEVLYFVGNTKPVQRIYIKCIGREICKIGIR